MERRDIIAGIATPKSKLCQWIAELGLVSIPEERGCYVDLKVNIGKSPPLKHRFMALEIAVPIIILGRYFLRQFNSTEFDWKKQHAKLEMSDVNRSFLGGGQVMSRTVAVNSGLQLPGNTSSGRREWNVNPDLTPHER